MRHLAIEQQSTAIVAHTPVQNRQTNVTENAIGEFCAEKVGEGLLAVKQRVRLQKVVFASVPAELQLRPETERCTLDTH